MAVSTIKENTKKFGKGQNKLIRQIITVGRITGSGNYLDFNLPIDVQDDVSNIAINVLSGGEFRANFSDDTFLTSANFDLAHAYVIQSQREHVSIEVPILSTQKLNRPVIIFLNHVSIVFP